MTNPQTLLYSEATEALKKASIITREKKQDEPKKFIVATHGPALVKAVRDNPNILDYIGIYRVNCSHLGKESDLPALAEYLRAVYPSTPILIDLQ